MEFREKGVTLLVLQLENKFSLENSFSLPSSKQGFATLGLLLPNFCYTSVSVETLRDILYVRYVAPFIVEKGARFA